MRWLDSISSSGHELEQTLGDNGGQRRLVCCSPWGSRVGRDLTTEQQKQEADSENYGNKHKIYFLGTLPFHGNTM